MKRLILTAITVLLASTPALAQERVMNQGQQHAAQQSDLRLGVGVSASQVDLRLEVNEANALDFLLNFSLQAGNQTNNAIGFGGQFLHRLVTDDDVNFHIVAGMTYGYMTGVIFGPRHENMVSVFSGVGAEYFMTPRFSLEANVGLGLDFAWEEQMEGPPLNQTETTVTTIAISPRSLTPGLLKLRYYF